MYKATTTIPRRDSRIELKKPGLVDPALYETNVPYPRHEINEVRVPFGVTVYSDNGDCDGDIYRRDGVKNEFRKLRPQLICAIGHAPLSPSVRGG